MTDNSGENVKTLLNELNQIYKNKELRVKTRKFEVSAATSFMSGIYERVRNTIDYKDEHLIRRFAIYRFLKVSLTSKSNPEELTELLIKDLLRGKYVDDSFVTDWTYETLVKVLAKYISSKQILNEMRISKDQGELWEFLVEVAASEIEAVLDPFYQPDTFVKLVSGYVLKSIRGSNLDLSPEQEGLHVFLACHRGLVRSDLSLLRYHALKILYPDFFVNPDSEKVQSIVNGLQPTKTYIDGIIKSPIQDHLFKCIRRIMPPFKVLEGVLESNPENLDEILSGPALLRDKSELFIQSFYSDLKKKLNLRITRTLVYLFITKMLLAVIIEAPVDLYFMGHINFVTLGVNTIFPILMFYVISKSIRVPGRENSDKVHDVIKSVVYDDRFFVSEQDERLFLRRVNSFRHTKHWLSYVYGTLYLGVYGLLILVLSKFGFNASSTFIFIFFVSVLSFFAWNIRARALELQLVQRREGLVESLLSIIALPILKVGQILSVEVSRFNFFTLVFDFILEAPFKIIVQSFEDIIDYFKSKHEEVVQG